MSMKSRILDGSCVIEEREDEDGEIKRYVVSNPKLSHDKINGMTDGQLADSLAGFNDD